MYRLLNLLFGWDYVQWKNSVDSGVARVHIAYDGTVYYWRYKSTRVADRIRDADNVLWLTCKPEKYLKENK